MTNNERKLKKLFELMDSEAMTADDFARHFQTVIDIVKKVKADIAAQREEIIASFADGMKSLQKKVDTVTTDQHARMVSDITKRLNKALKEQEDGMNWIRDKVRSLKDGKDADEQRVIETVLKMIPPTEYEEAPAIRNKLEKLQGEERLDKSAIRGIEKLEEDIKSAKQIKISGGGGGRGIQLHVDGSRKGLTSQSINLIGGTGVTLTYSQSHGRNDITISAAGGSLAVLAATGTVDDSNTTFTFISAPTLVIVNGAAYRHGSGVTITGTSAVLDNPVGTGGDIYAIG
jgi:protein-arginine kinase activator protein McsA